MGEIDKGFSYMTIIHLLAGIIFMVAFMQGIKAGILGTLIGLVVGTGTALAFFYGGWIFCVWLPKRLGIFKLIWYEEAEVTLSSKEKVLSVIYWSIIIFVWLIWLVLCTLCSDYLTKFLL